MKKRVLIVDDLELNRLLLGEILEDEYQIYYAENGKRAVEILKDKGQELSVVLLDLIMPVMDGYGVLNYMKEEGMIGKIPILVISSETSQEAEEKCFTLGVSDFIKKPFSNNKIRQRVQNIVSLFSYKNKLEEEVNRQNRMVRRQYALLEEQAEKLQESNSKIVDILGTVVEYRNLEGHNHIWHVREMTKVLATQMAKDYPEYGLTLEKISVIAAASALHDIGKIAIPDSILLKPGRLTKEEFDVMKTHSIKGCEIIASIQNVWDKKYGKACYDISRHHHERFDGGGYPDGLTGDDIPISAQLVSIADAYDALISKRVYKDAYAKDTAFEMILNGECGAFSPKLLDCFKKSKEKLEQLNWENSASGF